MAKRDPELDFISAVEGQFAFLVTDDGFTCAGQVAGGETDPREAERRVRYFNSARTVDVILSMTGGLGVEVGGLPPPVDSRVSGTNPPRPIVRFEQFLLARHAASLAPPFPEMKPHKVFVTMYSQQLSKYMKVVAPRMPAAVGVMAERFKIYGRELLTADLERIAAETRSIRVDKPVAPT